VIWKGKGQSAQNELIGCLSLVAVKERSCSIDGHTPTLDYVGCYSFWIEVAASLKKNFSRLRVSEDCSKLGRTVLTFFMAVALKKSGEISFKKGKIRNAF
jgi:hypothetical protein